MYIIPKLYKVHFKSERDSSCGFEFFSSRREAAKSKAEWIAEDEDDRSTEIEEFNVSPTKAGIMQLLRDHARHARNG